MKHYKSNGFIFVLVVLTRPIADWVFCLYGRSKVSHNIKSIYTSFKESIAVWAFIGFYEQIKRFFDNTIQYYYSTVKTKFSKLLNKFTFIKITLSFLQSKMVYYNSRSHTY